MQIFANIKKFITSHPLLLLLVVSIIFICFSFFLKICSPLAPSFIETLHDFFLGIGITLLGITFSYTIFEREPGSIIKKIKKIAIDFKKLELKATLKSYSKESDLHMGVDFIFAESTDIIIATTSDINYKKVKNLKNPPLEKKDIKEKYLQSRLIKLMVDLDDDYLPKVIERFAISPVSVYSIKFIYIPSGNSDIFSEQIQDQPHFVYLHYRPNSKFNQNDPSNNQQGSWVLDMQFPGCNDIEVFINSGISSSDFLESLFMKNKGQFEKSVRFGQWRVKMYDSEFCKKEKLEKGVEGLLSFRCIRDRIRETLKKNINKLQNEKQIESLLQEIEKI